MASAAAVKQSPDPSEISRYVIITGASDGIGLELARILAEQPSTTVLGTGSRPTSELPDTFPDKAKYLQLDQADNQCGIRLLSEVEKLGWPSISNLVLNAGYGKAIDPLEEEAGNIQKTVSINLTAPIAISHALAPLLFAATNSTLTLIGSTAASGAKDFASYAATKAGLAGFARALESEWQNNVRVQIIHPGPTATQMHAKAGLDVGSARRFFVRPADSAARIFQLINSGKPSAKISFLFALSRAIRRVIGQILRVGK